MSDRRGAAPTVPSPTAPTPTVPSPTPTPTGREFHFDAAHFQLVRSLAFRLAGIELKESKEELVYGRLARRLRTLGLDNFDDYCALLQRDDSPELSSFINSITTNVTSFFRESHHFDYLRDQALPKLAASRPDRRLRIWSAACSTGQEPYSIAATMASAAGDSSGRRLDCKILATDIDSDALAQGEAGIYSGSGVPSPEELGPHATWFSPTRDGRQQISPVLRNMIYFRRLNLMAPWPMTGKMDVIFCRNVVIYFSVETQRKLFKRFAEILAPDGYIFIGHSESMLHSADLFTLVGKAVYQPTGLHQ